MATAHFDTTLKNTLLDAIKTAIDSGGAAGTINFYTGTMPATPGTSITTQTLLGTLTFSYPCAPGASAGILTMSAITQDSSADATGTATWARCLNSAGVAKLDVDVSNTAGSGAAKLNTTSIVSGGPISITSFAISIP